MTNPVQPETLGSILTDLQSRVQKLESYPPSTMQLLVQSSTGSTALANVLSFADISATRTPTFTLLRPVPLLVIPILVVDTPGTGAASYLYAECVVEDVNNGNAVVAASPDGVHSNSPPLPPPYLPTSGASDITAPFQATLGPGTFSAVWRYYLDGATTTATLIQSQVDVFRLGG